MGLMRLLWELFLKVLFGKTLFSSEVQEVTLPSVSAPTNTSAPVISGTYQEGRTLTCSTGAWNSNGGTIAYTYQWKTSPSTNISGATSSTYVVQNSDIGNQLLCTVTATNSAGSNSANSNTSDAIVTGAANAPTNLVLTAIQGGFQATWSEPTDNGYALTSYTVQYKLAADGGFTDYEVTYSGDTLPEFAEITGLSAEEYTVKVYASTAYGDSAATDTDVITPLANSTVQDAIPLVGGKGLVAYWSAKQHDGTSVWANVITSPADGAAQDAYDITGAGTAPTWDGQKFVMNNSGRWAGNNTTFINSLHQTTSGNAWTWFAYAKTNVSSAQLDSMFGTADSDTDTGVSIRVDSGGSLKLDQRTGTRVTAENTPNTTTNTLYKLVIRRDQDAGETSFALNEDTFEVKTHNYTTNTSNPTYAYNIGAEGNGGNPMDSNTELYCVGLINRAISDAELAALNDAIENEFTPPEPTVPGQVDSVQATPSDRTIHVAWRLIDNGGVSTSDVTYTVEYKTTAGSTWSTGATTQNYKADVTGLTNGTSYDIRVTASNSVGAGTASATKTVTPLVKGTAPYSLSYYKTTNPTAATTGARTGSAEEILQPELLTYTGPWFGRGDGYIDFYCPDGGATTATATYCRSELRHLTNFAYSTSCEDTLRFAVLDIPDGGKTVVHQIHGLDNPWIKMVYTGKDNGTGTLRALIKPNYGDADVSTTVLTGITNGDAITSRIVYTYTGSNAGQLQIYINGSLAHTSALNRSAVDGDGGAAYWKRGNYFQDATRSGNICKVRHYTQSGQYVP